jgi:hypothetical protein
MRLKAAELMIGVTRCATERVKDGPSPKFDEALVIVSSFDLAVTAVSAN